MKAKLLDAVLLQLQQHGEDIEASAILSNDGLVLSTLLSENLDKNRFAAITAALLSLAARAAEEFNRGRVAQIMVRGDEGNFIVTSASVDAVLVVLTRKSSRLGLSFIDCNHAAEEIKQILSA